MDFAKIFKRGERQVCVIIQHNDDGDPEVRFFFDPLHEDLNLCSSAVVFQGSMEGATRRFFDALDEEKAFSTVDDFIKQIHEAF